MTTVAVHDNGWWRVLRYARLGPLFGGSAILCTATAAGAISNGVSEKLVALAWLVYGPVIIAPFAYLIGFLPASLVGLIDRLLWRRGAHIVVHLCAVVIAGFAACFLPLLWVFGMRSITLALHIGAVGAFAALCCCLACVQYVGRRRAVLDYLPP